MDDWATRRLGKRRSGDTGGTIGWNILITTPMQNSKLEHVSVASLLICNRRVKVFV